MILASASNIRLLAHPYGLNRTPMETGKAGRTAVADHSFTVLQGDVIHRAYLYACSAANAVLVGCYAAEIIGAGNRRQGQHL